jgi:uncharacterized membrane protein
MYLKCVLFGLLAMVIASTLTFFGMSAWAFFKLGGMQGAEINFDPVSWLHSSIVPWTILLLGFFAGFFWKLRSLRHLSG